MSKIPKTYYRYRAFSTTTLDSLCHDTLHFANPGTFNDPLDCAPSVECDSDVPSLRWLLQELVARRVRSEVLASLKQAKLKGPSATEHAEKRARKEAESQIDSISYDARDPDYYPSPDAAEKALLTYAIERELIRHFDRGVCCFSTTYASPLLWSHYGDQHRGLCIGYGLDRLPVPKLQRVKYGGNRSVKTSTMLSAFVMESSAAKDQLDEDVLLRKAKGWSYEREWRLIGKQGLQDSPLLLMEITFGLRCSQSIKHSVVRALAGRSAKVRFYEMYEVRGKYRLGRRVLNIDEMALYLPSTAVSGIEVFGEGGFE